jgi:hypothetical protein
MTDDTFPVNLLLANLRIRELEQWMAEYVARGWDIPHTFVRDWLMAKFGQSC